MLVLDRVTITQDDFSLTADWQVKPGERVAIIGPSGAGKSTLLTTIAGFIMPSAGRILWQGQDMARLTPGQRPLSILFQDQNLFPHLTVAQNLGLGLSPALKLGPAQHTAISEALARVGLSDKAKDRPGSLSGGEQSRVALARALLRARPILLLDEPFAALGPGLKSEMLALVAEIATATAALVLMITHDPEDARRFAPLTVLVEGGVAHAPVPTLDLLADPPPALRAYLGS
ncbi:MAG: ATP-binding cassette domain-containing protein [Gemmobacter sp.]|nr:ATP-binding cassette domain-containing protein [Gemmobacter sp.]